MNSNFNSWILALRPKTLTAALVPIIVATALVYAMRGSVMWWVSIATLLAAFLIQIATNLINDAIDFDKGADTETRTGPVRVTQTGLLTPKQVMTGGFVCLGLAFALGIPLAIQGGWPIVFIGMASLFLAYGYTGGPFPLAYLGLGEVFVVLFFGVIAVGGTFFLHTHVYNSYAWIAGLQIGFLATVLIAINNLRDSPQDALVGKKTLAVRFGQKFAKTEIAVFALAPYLFGLVYAYEEWMLATALPLLSLPLAIILVRGVWRAEPGVVMNRYLAMAAGLQLAFGLLLSIGLWIGA